MDRWFDQVGGIITVRIQGKNLEKLINMALSRGIYIWNIKKEEEYLILQIRNSGFEALQNLAAEHAFSLEVINKQGLPVFRQLIKRRFGFVTGVLIFILALYGMSSFIWFIDVTGNEKVPASRILLSASRHGLYQGAAKWNFKRLEVEEAMMKDFHQLTYIKVDIRGVRASIQVVEKILPEEQVTGPCHIVAARNGVIYQVLVLEGQQRVKEGDVVAQGDILISGIVFPESNPFMPELTEDELQPYQVRARGVVKARVWYEGYGECKLKNEEKVSSGRALHKIYLLTPWKKIKIWGKNDIGFEDYSTKINEKTVRSPLGEFGFSRTKYIEQTVKVTEYTEREATRLARQKAIKVLQDKIGKLQDLTEAKTEVISSPSDPMIRLKISVEVIQDIAQPEPLNGGSNSV